MTFVRDTQRAPKERRFDLIDAYSLNRQFPLNNLQFVNSELGPVALLYKIHKVERGVVERVITKTPVNREVCIRPVSDLLR